MYFYSCLSWKMFHLYRIVCILSFNLWDCVPLVFLVPVYMTDSLRGMCTFKKGCYPVEVYVLIYFRFKDSAPS